MSGDPAEGEAERGDSSLEHAALSTKGLGQLGPHERLDRRDLGWADLSLDLAG